MIGDRGWGQPRFSARSEAVQARRLAEQALEASAWPPLRLPAGDALRAGASAAGAFALLTGNGVATALGAVLAALSWTVVSVAEQTMRRPAVARRRAAQVVRREPEENIALLADTRRLQRAVADLRDDLDARLATARGTGAAGRDLAGWTREPAAPRSPAAGVRVPRQHSRRLR